jgi:hypothetical protein
MSTPFVPPSWWESGTLQNSIPANDNALRFWISQTNVNNATTAQPGSPADGDAYIIQATHTGAQWATFTPKDVAIFFDGTWYAFAPHEGQRVSVSGALYIYTGGAWTASGGGGGAVAGADKQVQFNDGGSAFGAEAGFEYDKTTDTLSVVKVNEARGSAIASATTTDIGAATGNFVHITGTTTITGLGTVAAGARRVVVFDGALTFTHNATSLILPTGANITTVAGDTATCISEGSGNWRVTSYQRKDGTALASAGASLTGFTASLNTSSPNATVNASVFAASGGTTIQDVVVSPKSTGAFILGPAPDSGTTGGNKRGVQAVDLQLNKNTATQVASGANSFLAGGFSTASGASASAIADSSTASGDYSFAIGRQTIASGIYSLASGFYSTARGTHGARVHSSGRMATTGDNQRGAYHQSGLTTGATPTPLGSIFNVTPVAATSIAMPNSSVYKFSAKVVGRNAAGDCAGFDIRGTIKRDANAASTALVGSVTVTSELSAGASTWLATAVANTTLGTVQIQVTGQAATTIEWAASIDTVELMWN